MADEKESSYFRICLIIAAVILLLNQHECWAAWLFLVALS